MSDASVVAALRSSARLVVIEAPAGCGKTHQGADYAVVAAQALPFGRVLILTHTHAACDVFAERAGAMRGIEIRTIDSLIAEIAQAYHASLGLPQDAAAWARRTTGYDELAHQAARLLKASATVRQALARRYPVIICDEHQDATADRHEVIMALHAGGAALRIFADPMQRIYSGRGPQIAADDERWAGLKEAADRFDELDQPHRWKGRAKELGQWMLAARTTLQGGGQIDLTGPLPHGLKVIFAENAATGPRQPYRLSTDEGRPIRQTVERASSMLILATETMTVDHLRSFFFRGVPIWEGHVRDELSKLVTKLKSNSGDASKVAAATTDFLYEVTKGFTASGFGNALLAEVAAGCVQQRRGKPLTLQQLGRLLLAEPDHRGVSKLLLQLRGLIDADAAFGDVKIDYVKEYWEAIHLARFDDPEEGFAEIATRRSRARPSLPDKAISTVHKAKGLQSSDVMILPCDRQHFSDNKKARALLYVAMSRAMRSLTIVASRNSPSPLIRI